MDATESSRARLTDTCPVRKIHMPARRRTGRHHLVIPGDIISERPGDFVGIGTPAVCRRCYIHPEVFEGFFDGTLLTTLAEKTRIYLTEEIQGMSAQEAAVVAFLRLRLGELAERAV